MRVISRLLSELEGKGVGLAGGGVVDRSVLLIAALRPRSKVSKFGGNSGEVWKPLGIDFRIHGLLVRDALILIGLGGDTRQSVACFQNPVKGFEVPCGEASLFSQPSREQISVF